MKEIDIIGKNGAGKTALIDDDDFDLVSKYKWRLLRTKGRMEYAATTYKKCKKVWITLLMHRLILGVSDRRVEVDHKNGSGLDNQRGNIRTCTRGQNSMNRPLFKNNTTGYTGVSWDKRRGLWTVQVTANKKNYKIRGFNDIKSAAIARDELAELLHKGFAKKHNM